MSEIGRLADQIGVSAVNEDRAWVTCALDELEQPLIRYAQMFVGNAESARDIVQEAFLKLCQQEPMDLPYVKSWLFKVCRNGAIDVCRKEQRVATGEVEISKIVGKRELEPAARFEQTEVYTSVMQHVDRLPVKQQEVLRLKFQSGFSYQDIADVTGLSKSNVGVLLHTAITKLRSNINPTNSSNRNKTRGSGRPGDG